MLGQTHGIAVRRALKNSRFGGRLIHLISALIRILNKDIGGSQMLLRYGEDRKVRVGGNLLFHSLSPIEQKLLSPHFEMITFPRGTVVARSGDAIDSIYFPVAGMFALEEGVGKNRHIEIAVVGREGLIGWAALLGCGHNAHDAVASGGDLRAMRIALTQLLAICLANSPLRVKLLNFVQTVMNQMACTITSHLERATDQRLARWLLMRHDRLFGDQIDIHHEEIAAALCTRRATVTDCLHILEGERLIRCNRGHIAIRDRFGLQIFAGGAYGPAEEHYRDLIAPFGKSASIEANGA